jgi:hypothetical protein
LGSGIGVRDKARLGCSQRDGHVQSVGDKTRPPMGGQLPADDHARVDVQDKGKVGESGSGADVGEIRDPQPVRPGGAELALHQVRRPCGGPLVADGGEMPSSTDHPTHARIAHQASDAITSDVHTAVGEFQPGALLPVDPAVPGARGDDLRRQDDVSAIPSRRIALTGLAVVVARCGYPDLWSTLARPRA